LKKYKINKEKYKINRKKLINAFLSLEKAVKEDINEYVQDSVIQRFEFTFELFRKTLKFYLLLHWFEENTPRSIMKKSFEINFLDEIEIYIDMIDIRNLTSHTYDSNLAIDVYNFIVKNYKKIGKVINKLKIDI